MSKKRRKKLKKLAKVLGAGLAIAGLGRAFANRNARASTDADTVKAMTSDAAYTTQDVAPPTKVYQDAIMRGDKGTKYQKPNLKFGQVINKKGDVQTLRPFENSGLTLGISNRKTNKTNAAVNKANKEMSKGMLPPQLRSPGRTNITTAQGDFRRKIKDIFTNPNINLSAQQGFTDVTGAKKGGRIVKTKSGGKAVRGYGKAYMKGRKK